MSYLCEDPWIYPSDVFESVRTQDSVLTSPERPHFVDENHIVAT